MADAFLRVSYDILLLIAAVCVEHIFQCFEKH